jgi:hypothetical protein
MRYSGLIFINIIIWIIPNLMLKGLSMIIITPIIYGLFALRPSLIKFITIGFALGQFGLAMGVTGMSILSIIPIFFILLLRRSYGNNSLNWLALLLFVMISLTSSSLNSLYFQKIFVVLVLFVLIVDNKVPLYMWSDIPFLLLSASVVILSKQYLGEFESLSIRIWDPYWVRSSDLSGVYNHYAPFILTLALSIYLYHKLSGLTLFPIICSVIIIDLGVRQMILATAIIWVLYILRIKSIRPWLGWLIIVSPILLYGYSYTHLGILDGRVISFLEAYDAFNDNPITGTGLGQFHNYYYSYPPPQTSVFRHHAHNIALEVIAELGLLGGFLLVKVMPRKVKNINWAFNPYLWIVLLCKASFSADILENFLVLLII